MKSGEGRTLAFLGYDLLLEQEECKTKASAGLLSTHKCFTGHLLKEYLIWN